MRAIPSFVVDPRKVRRVLTHYRLTAVWVIAVNVVLLCIPIYLLTRSVLGSVSVLTFTFLYCFCMVLLIDSTHNNGKATVPPDCFQPSSLEYKDIVTEWELACTHVGYRSAGVYVVDPSLDERYREHGNFSVLRPSSFSRTAVLFVGKAMLRRFPREEIHAAIAHECGHLRHMPKYVRDMVQIVSMPATELLRGLPQWRLQLPSRSPIAHIIYQAERVLYFATVFFAVHAEEYAADAYAAHTQGTTAHILDILIQLNLPRLSALYSDIPLLRCTELEHQSESHWQTHPPANLRLERLIKLHVDRS